MVPATLQRLRCFLNIEGRLKVRPWAGADEVLDAFHDALRARRADERFWEGIGKLLAALIEDGRRRGDGHGAGAINADVIAPERRGALLDEIRRALSAHRRGCGRFRRLARTLSAPALGLLLVLGGVATVGCYGSHGEDDRDAAGDGADVHDGTTADDAATPDAMEATDEVVPEVLPDACVPGMRSFEEIVAACIPAGEYRDAVLACVAALHESWRAGLTTMLECEDCSTVFDRLQTCLTGGFARSCDDPGDAGEFDEETFLDNCAVLLYLGVRFE